MRKMYDSVTLKNCPTDGDLYAGYVDGRYKNFGQLPGLFPGKVHVPIAVFASTNDGVVLDVESGDATPAQAPGWVSLRRAHGVTPTVYTSASWWGHVWQEFHHQGVEQPYYWIAHYDNKPVIPGEHAGCVAKQYADPGPYDISVVVDYWPGIDKPPTGGTVVNSGSLPGEEVDFKDVSVATDANGNGWVDLPGVDPEKVVSIVPEGSFPYPAGYVKVGDWNIAKGSKGEAVVVVEGGKPSFGLFAKVWVHG